MNASSSRNDACWTLTSTHCQCRQLPSTIWICFDSNRTICPRAVSRDVLEANDRGIEERLAALKMVGSVTEPIPTVAGLLVLGKRPQDFIPGGYVQFLRIAGTKWGDPVIDEERCDGSILDQIRRLDEKLSSHNRTAVDFTTESQEIRQSTYPLGSSSATDSQRSDASDIRRH